MTYQVHDPARLTPTEQRVLDIFLSGKFQDKEIAKEMGPSYNPTTAGAHMTSIFSKLGVHSRAELIYKFRGLLK